MNKELQWFTASLNNKDNFIGINRMYLESFDYDYDLTVFFQQIMFWASGKSKLGFGSFYKTSFEFGCEIGFSESKIRHLKTRLKKHGLGQFIAYKNKKVNGTPTTHYQVDFEGVSAWFYDENCETPKLANGNAEIGESMETPKLASPIYTDPNHIQTSNRKIPFDLRKKGFLMFWNCWEKNKEKLGVRNNSSEIVSMDKFDSIFNKSYFNKHSEDDFALEIQAMCEHADEIHKPGQDGFCSAKNMMTGKFFTNKGWK